LRPSRDPRFAIAGPEGVPRQSARCRDWKHAKSQGTASGREAADKAIEVDANIKTKLAGKSPEFLTLYTAAIQADGGAARRQIEKDIQAQLRDTAKALADEEKINKANKAAAKRAAGKRGGSKPTAEPSNKKPRKNALGQTECPTIRAA